MLLQINLPCDTNDLGLLLISHFFNYFNGRTTATVYKSTCGGKPLPSTASLLGCGAV
jgi:hypothetical protein